MGPLIIVRRVTVAGSFIYTHTHKRTHDMILVLGLEGPSSGTYVELHLNLNYCLCGMEDVRFPSCLDSCFLFPDHCIHHVDFMCLA